jgi:hypothetical protein
VAFLDPRLLQAYDSVIPQIDRALGDAVTPETATAAR